MFRIKGLILLLLPIKNAFALLSEACSAILMKNFENILWWCLFEDILDVVMVLFRQDI